MRNAGRVFMPSLQLRPVSPILWWQSTDKPSIPKHSFVRGEREGEGLEHLCTFLKMFQLRILERKIGLCLNFHGDRLLVNNITNALANRSSTMKIKFQSQALIYYFMGNNGFRRGEILSLKISGLLVQVGSWTQNPREVKVWNRCESESRSVVPDSLQPHGLHSPWDSPGLNTGVGGLSLLQGVFPTQGLNPGLPHCRRTLPAEPQGKPSEVTVKNKSIRARREVGGTPQPRESKR